MTITENVNVALCRVVGEADVLVRLDARELLRTNRRTPPRKGLTNADACPRSTCTNKNLNSHAYLVGSTYITGH